MSKFHAKFLKIDDADLKVLDLCNECIAVEGSLELVSVDKCMSLIAK